VDACRKLAQEGKLRLLVDKTPFVGLESVADAIDHLYAGKNVGKIIVALK
jgi:prostaglandin reductase 3